MILLARRAGGGRVGITVGSGSIGRLLSRKTRDFSLLVRLELSHVGIEFGLVSKSGSFVFDSLGLEELEIRYMFLPDSRNNAHQQSACPVLPSQSRPPVPPSPSNSKLIRWSWYHK
jgi:hypothetical protein